MAIFTGVRLAAVGGRFGNVVVVVVVVVVGLVVVVVLVVVVLPGAPLITTPRMWDGP